MLSHVLRTTHVARVLYLAEAEAVVRGVVGVSLDLEGTSVGASVVEGEKFRGGIHRCLVLSSTF